MTSVFRLRHAAALGAVAITVLVSAGSAAAAPQSPFGCRASTTRAKLLNSSALTLEPLIANASGRCHTASHGLSSVNVLQTGKSFINAGPAGVYTFATDSSTAPGAAALSDVQGVSIPTGSGGQISIVGPVESSASYGCVSGKLVRHSASTLDVIYVNGKAIALPAPGAPMRINLGGGAYAAINERLLTPNSVTERVLDVHVPGLVDLIVGEARVTRLSADPCAGTAGSPPPSLGACPPGSKLDVKLGVCVITVPGKTRTIIIVGPPFKGPKGGKVLSLKDARKRYHSPCLYGPGPNYVLVATRKHGRVTGTPHADRLLALGAYERVAGLAGNDCIDGQGRNQTLWDGNGKDRVYGGPGRTRIGVGNGNSKVWGRQGRDWITAGNGNDVIHGGRQGSRIDAGLGRDHVFGGSGSNRVFVASNRAWVSCGTGHHNVAFLRRGAAGWAHRHGCQHIHYLR